MSKQVRMGVSKKAKVDMSAAAVTARLKRACRLGESELLLMRALSLSAQLRPTTPVDQDKSGRKGDTSE